MPLAAKRRLRATAGFRLLKPDIVKQVPVMAQTHGGQRPARPTLAAQAENPTCNMQDG